MADIHGWIWVLVGAFVVGVSLYIGNLRFFIIIGFLFTAWGAFKLARDFIVPPEKIRLKPWERAKEQLSDSLGPQGQAKQSKGPQTMACPTCMTLVWKTAHFCHFCGMRLKNP